MDCASTLREYSKPTNPLNLVPGRCAILGTAPVDCGPMVPVFVATPAWSLAVDQLLHIGILELDPDLRPARATYIRQAQCFVEVE